MESKEGVGSTFSFDLSLKKLIPESEIRMVSHAEVQKSMLSDSFKDDSYHVAKMPKYNKKKIFQNENFLDMKFSTNYTKHLSHIKGSSNP